MTWNTFTRAIEESELVSGTQAQILLKLFIRAGNKLNKEDRISESTAKKWIDGTRKCKVSTYFPDEEDVQKQELYNFFIRRPQDKLKKLQQIFYKEIDENSPIDYTTKDMDRFCWSLVNQFLDLLGFQRIDITASDTSQNEITHQKDSQSKNQGAQIAIPQGCKVCLCCIYWQGNAEVAYKNIDNEYGECKALAKRVLAADGAGCDKFKESYGKIMKYDFYKKNQLEINLEERLSGRNL